MSYLKKSIFLQHYSKVGKMIVMALTHGGLFPSFFSERLYQNLCSSSPTLEEGADVDLQCKLKKE